MQVALARNPPARLVTRLATLALAAVCVHGCATGPAPTPDEGARPRPRAAVAVLSRINRERSRVGAAPLEPDAELGARALKRAMARAGGGRAAGAGDAAGVGDSGGARRGLTLEVSARGRHVATLVDALLADAASRSKLLNGDVTHAGVAVVAHGAVLGVTVLSARLSPRADVRHAPARLFDQINEGRGVRGAAPLVRDATLEAVARTAAERFFQPPLPDERDLVAQVHAELEPFGLAYARVEATMAVVATVEEAARLEPAFDPAASAVGLGIAQGTRSQGGPRVVAVVLVLGWSRGTADKSP